MLKALWIKLAHFGIALGIGIASLFGGTQPQFGATIPTTVSLFETSLQSSIASTDNAMTLVVGTDRQGNTLSGYYCFLVDGGTASQEFICGTVAGTAVTSLVRGIDPQNPNTSQTGLQFSHRRGADVKITDYPQLAILSRILNGTDTVPNVLLYNSAPTFNTNLQIIDKQYADGLTFAGAPNGNTTTKGIFQEATTSQINAGTGAGSTGADLTLNPSQFSTSIYNVQLPTVGQKNALVGDNSDIAVGSGNTYVTQTGLQKQSENYAITTGSANAYVLALSPVPTSYASGMTIHFQANFANTSAVTINVNSLGAKNITKNGTTALVANDILNSGLYTAVYDGTEFQLTSPTGNVLSTTKQFISVATTTVANTNVETTLFTTTVAANTLGTNNAIHGRVHISDVHNAGTSGTLTYSIKYGGTAVTTCLLSFDTFNSQTSGILDFYIIENNATNVQVAHCFVSTGTTELKTTPAITSNAWLINGGNNGGAIDDTASQTLSVTATWSVANANLSTATDQAVFDIVK